MTQFEDFKTIVKVLKSTYTKQEFLPDAEAVTAWYYMLKDLDFEVLKAAAYKYAITQKFPPTVADLREMAVSVTAGDMPLWSDGWEQVQTAIRKFGIGNATGALNSMDSLTAATVRRLGWTNLCLSKDPMPDRANFRTIYEQLAKREQVERQLPMNLTQLIDGLQQNYLLEEK